MCTTHLIKFSGLELLIINLEINLFEEYNYFFTNLLPPNTKKIEICSVPFLYEYSQNKQAVNSLEFKK